DAQGRGVQRRARERDRSRVFGSRVQLAAQHRTRVAVAWIDEQRMTQGGEVHADLMGASAPGPAAAQRAGAEALDRSNVGACGPGAIVLRSGDARTAAPRLG